MSIGLVAFLFGVAVFAGVYAVVAPRHNLVSELDNQLAPGVEARDGSGDGIFDRLIRPVIRNFLPQTPMAAVAKARNNSKTIELLVQAGNPWRIQPEEFFGLRVLAAIGGFFVALAAGVVGLLPPILPVYGWMLVGAALGFYIPRVLLDRARGARRKQARKGLPEALDMLVICLNAGQNFQPALAEVVGRLPEGIIKTELERVSADLRSGRTLHEALLDFARRVPSDEVEGFCKAVIQAEKLGADVTDTLKAQSGAARQAYEAAMDERIAKLGTTLFIPILALMLPALFIVILAPAISNIGAVL